MASSTGFSYSRVAIALAASCGAVVLTAGMAGAAFPAINGAIVFQSTRAASAPGCLYGSTSELFVKQVTGPATVSQLDCTGSTDQHPFVSPDGSEVIFASNRNDGVDFNLFTMPLNTATPLGTPVDVSQNLPSGASDDYPSWAPAPPGDQNLIIFQSTRGGGQPELYTEDLNNPGSVAPVFTQTQAFSDTEPVYDPSNANEIAFVRTSGSGKSQIYTYNFVTKAPPVNLSAADGDGNANDSKPDFAPSPDGSGVQVIVFQSDRPTPNAANGPCVGTQLYTMSDQAGSAIKPVFQQLTGSPPQPNGVQVCATSKDAQAVATGTKVAAENPVFSPDGTQVAFDQLASPDSAGTTQDVLTAYSAPFSGGVAQTGDLVDLTPNFATDQAPSWAPVSPGASTPETPGVLLLPLAGGGLVGGAIVLSRRRRSMS